MEYLRLCSFMVVWILLIHVSDSSSLSDVRYYGCFDDKFQPDRALGTYMSYPYTLERCIAECRQLKYTFAGLQNYGECWCGENYDRYGITYKCFDGHLGPCSEDRSNVCGGAYANSVFKVCPGFSYGSNCESNNPDCGNRGTDVNGTCLSTCPPGFRGAECDEACPEGSFGPGCRGDCTSRCVNNRCDPRLGYCLEGCKTGLVGPFCLSSCQGLFNKPTGPCPFCGHCKNSVCAGAGGGCYYQCPREWEGAVCGSCEAGFYTSLCNEPCPAGCTSDGCDMSTGDCIACKLGLYGPKCENNCADGCENECDRNSGECDSCVLGKYGRYCNMICGQCSGGQCNRDNGHCSPCIDGYFGEKCNFICPDTCNNASCDQNSGMCYSCVSGYYGPFCAISCGKCSIGICDYENGTCTPCKPGYFGPTCNTPCNKTCPDAGCDQVSGECIGCNNGWYGHTCSLSCPVNCVKKLCDQTSENCTFGCTSSFYGPLCDQECPGCSGGACDTYGVCVAGCVDGKTGALCNEACPPGTFGSNCSLRCHCEGGEPCDAVSGRCDHAGCQEGWSGDDCQAEALQGGIDVVAIAAPVAVVILVIIVIITVVIVMLVRRKRTKKVDENPNLENMDSAYAEISNDEQPKSNQSTGYGPYEEVDIPTVTEGVFYENAQELKYQSLIGTYTNSNNHNLENIDNAYAAISNDDRPKSNL